jgi:hypothetical protein
MSVYVGKPPQDMVHTATELLFGSWHWMLLLAIIGLILWIWRRRTIDYPLLLMLGLIAVITLSYVVQRKGFGYHLGGALPLMMMFAAVGFDVLRGMIRHPARQPSGRRIMSAVLIGMILLAAAGTATKLLRYRAEALDLRNGMTPVGRFGRLNDQDQAQLIDIIGKRSGPDDRVVLYGTAYQIPYLARRLPAYRFITPAIEQMTPNFSLYPEWKAEIANGLKQHRPKFILIMHDDANGDPEDIRRSGHDARPVLQTIISYMGDDYGIALKGEFGVLYERIAQ